MPTEVMLDRHEVRRGEATTAPNAERADRAEPSAEEREALMSQLKILGYMD